MAVSEKKVKRKYAVDLEKAIKEAETNYVEAVLALQERCAHKVVLECEERNYEQFRVCEDCGATSRSPWGSSFHAFGNLEVFDVKRAYKVDWTTFARTTPKILGWCQKSDEPSRFRRGGKVKVDA